MKKTIYAALTVLLVIIILLAGSVGYLMAKLNDKDIEKSDTTVLQSMESSSTSQDVSDQVDDTETESQLDTEPKQNSESDQEVTGLCCSMQLGTLDIIEGEDFQVSELNGIDYESTTENGVFTIIGSTAGENHIVVTIPKGYVFQTVELEATGGAIAAENITTENLYTDCGQGSIEFTGSVNSLAEINQFQGQTVLNIYGTETDFNYDLKLQYGHIGVGSIQLAAPNESKNLDNGAEKSMKITCSMGTVNIIFD